MTFKGPFQPKPFRDATIHLWLLPLSSEALPRCFQASPPAQLALQGSPMQPAAVPQHLLPCTSRASAPCAAHPSPMQPSHTIEPSLRPASLDPAGTSQPRRQAEDTFVRTQKCSFRSHHLLSGGGQRSCVVPRQRKKGAGKVLVS